MDNPMTGIDTRDVSADPPRMVVVDVVDDVVMNTPFLLPEGSIPFCCGGCYQYLVGRVVVGTLRPWLPK